MNKRGMTLVEVVVSLALLAITTLTFVSLFFMSTKMIVSSNKQKKAELDLRKYAEGFVGSAGHIQNGGCIDSILKVPIGGKELVIAGQVCKLTDKETGVSYEYYKVK